MASELGDAFDVECCLTHGALPGIYSEQDPETRALALRSYTEVQAEALATRAGEIIGKRMG